MPVCALYLAGCDTDAWLVGQLFTCINTACKMMPALFWDVLYGFACRSHYTHGTSWYVLQMDLQQPGQYANVMSFKYMRGPVVTILVSKSAGRYRIQSDSFEAMWLIVQV